MPRQHLGTHGALGHRLDAFDEGVASIDIDTGIAISESVAQVEIPQLKSMSGPDTVMLFRALGSSGPFIRKKRDFTGNAPSSRSHELPSASRPLDQPGPGSSRPPLSARPRADALPAGGILAYICNPVVDRLQNLRLPRLLAVVVVLLLVAAILAALALILVPLVAEEAAILSARLPDWLAMVNDRLSPWLSQRFGVHLKFDPAALKKLVSENWSSLQSSRPQVVRIAHASAARRSSECWSTWCWCRSSCSIC